MNDINYKKFDDVIYDDANDKNIAGVIIYGKFLEDLDGVYKIETYYDKEFKHVIDADVLYKLCSKKIIDIFFSIPEDAPNKSIDTHTRILSYGYDYKENVLMGFGVTMHSIPCIIVSGPKLSNESEVL